MFTYIYIYISIYNRGADFQVPGSKTTDLPPGFRRKKLSLDGSGFGSLFWDPKECSEPKLGRLSEEFLARIWTSRLELGGDESKGMKMRCL